MSDIMPQTSKKGTQRVVVVPGNGVTTITVTDIRKNIHHSVTIFNELLPGVIARLSAIAISQKGKDDILLPVQE